MVSIHGLRPVRHAGNTMKGYGFFYYIAEAFRGLRANAVVNTLAVGTISMAMLLVGLFLVVFLNLQSALTAVSDRLELSVYLKDGLTEPERDFLGMRLRTEPGITKVGYLSKAGALERFRKELKGQEQLIEGLGENPLPASFEAAVDLKRVSPPALEAMAKKISAFPGVEDVVYGKRGAEALSGLLALVTYGGFSLAVLLGLSVVFIISNSVRLALYSRGQEIELMQWIGATRGFIQGPFLVEGMLVAVTGTALALGILAALHAALPGEVVYFIAGAKGLDFLSSSVVAYMTAGSGLLGLIGALISTSRFLE